LQHSAPKPFYLANLTGVLLLVGLDPNLLTHGLRSGVRHQPWIYLGSQCPLRSRCIVPFRPFTAVALCG